MPVYSWRNILRSIHPSNPPWHSYKISISAFRFKINMRCSSARHSGSGPSLAHTGLFRSIAMIFFRSCIVNERRALSPSTSGTAMISVTRRPSHCNVGTLSRAFWCKCAAEPYLYVDMMAMPCGSPSVRAYKRGARWFSLGTESEIARRNLRVRKSGYPLPYPGDVISASSLNDIWRHEIHKIQLTVTINPSPASALVW